MLDDQGVQTFWHQMETLWIAPELERRSLEERLPNDFKIRRCLIKLPPGLAPIVEFNEEVRWAATIRKPQGISFAKGDSIKLSHVISVETVERPNVDGNPVPFVYACRAGLGWQLIFDFEQPGPKSDDQNQEEEWIYGRAIAETLNAELQEMAVGVHDALQEQIKAIGLWPAPALLPYPLSAIAQHCGAGNPSEARRLLVTHCNIAFLEQLVSKWNECPVFAARATLFQQALEGHRSGLFTLTIPALLPQIEGVVTDWLYSLNLRDAIPFRQESKTKAFRTILTNSEGKTAFDMRVAEAALSFILEGPVLETFKAWLDPVREEFPNRNAVGHGRFIPIIHTEENSIKLFLILDTLFHVIVKHEDKD